jgi:hypothetical protein
MSTLRTTHIITVYVVYGIDYKGSNTNLEAVYSDEASAKAALDDYQTYEVRKAVELPNGDVYLLDPCCPEPVDLDKQLDNLEQQIKETALNKLTPEEIRILKKRGI